MTKRIPPDVAAQIAQLFVSESEAVFRSAMHAARRDRNEAEDLVQEAFQAAALNWDKIVNFSMARKRAWLCRVAINKAVDSYRAGRLATDVSTERERPSAEHVALTRIQKDRCLKVISEMPEMRSRVAYLKFHEEWDTGEIADHLGISPATVRVHLHDARVMLDKAVGPEVFLTDESGGEVNLGGEEA
jgi:RNA polymerase sigma factor (sigma-70 family)